mmetsp:Transcript_5818/g.8280  ORF Transcript_5818/g.8280 Transcript_5818/m.8280 type:complete len:213 (-) Transcript_5818:433-1071(-)
MRKMSCVRHANKEKKRIDHHAFSAFSRFFFLSSATFTAIARCKASSSDKLVNFDDFFFLFFFFLPDFRVGDCASVSLLCCGGPRVSGSRFASCCSTSSSSSSSSSSLSITSLAKTSAPLAFPRFLVDFDLPLPVSPGVTNLATLVVDDELIEVTPVPDDVVLRTLFDLALMAKMALLASTRDSKTSSSSNQPRLASSSSSISSSISSFLAII